MKQMIGEKYEVIEELGRGGWGNIFKVKDLFDGRTKVLKLVTNKDEEPFLIREFEILFKLRYPNIVTVYDLHRSQTSNSFFTMEYLEGYKINELVNPQSLDTNLVYDVFLQLFRTLSYLHSRSILHCDLNINNIIVTKTLDANDNLHYTAKLIDFGLARSLLAKGQEGIPRTTGNLAYMPPEMHMSGKIDNRGDLYSLGVIMYEAVTGTNPFLYENMKDTVHAHLTKQVPHARKINNEVPIRMSQIIEKLLSKDPGLRYGSAEEVVQDMLTPSKATRIPTIESVLCESPLVGREDEIELLKSRIEHTQLGNFHILGVRGVSGIGKRHLLHEFLCEAQIACARVYEGSLGKAEKTAYQSLQKILRALILDRGKEGKHFFDEHRLLLNRILPNIGNGLKGITTEPVQTEESDRNRYILYDAIYKFLISSTMGNSAVVQQHIPNVWIFENINMVDRGTLDFITYLIRQRNLERERRSTGENPLPLMIVFGVNSDERHPLEEFSEIEWLDLHGLSQPAAEKMVTYILSSTNVPEELLAALLPATNGIPLFIGELIHNLVENEVVVYKKDRWVLKGDLAKYQQSIDSLDTFIVNRLEQLTPVELEVAQYASILKSGFTDEELIAVSNNTIKDVLGVLNRLRALHIIVGRIEDEQVLYYFMFPQIQEAIYKKTPEDMRLQGHKRAGKYFEKLTRQSNTDYTFQLAHHFTIAGNKIKGSEYAMEAAKQAEKAFSYALAIDLYKKSLDLLEDEGGLKQKFETITHIADIYKRQGKNNEAWEWLDVAQQLIKNRKFPMSRISELYQEMARIKLRQYDYATAKELAEKALRLIPDWNEFREGVSARYLLAYTMYYQGKADEALSYCVETFSGYKWKGNEIEKPHLFNLMGMIYQEKEDWNKALDYYEKAHALLDEKTNPKDVGSSLINIGTIHFLQGNTDLARQYFEKSIDLTTKIGDVYQLIRNYRIYASMLRKRGLVDESEKYLTRAIDMAEKVNDSQMLIHALMILGNLYLDQSQWFKALDQMQRALVLAREMNNKRDLPIILLNLGIIEEKLGKFNEALQHFNESLALSQNRGNQMSIAKIYSYLALIYKDMQDYQTAMRFLGDAAKIFLEHNCERDYIPVLLRMAEIKLSQLLLKAAELDVNKALELAQKIDSKLEKGESYHLKAKIHIEKNEYDLATDLLFEALKIFMELKNIYRQSQVQTTLAKLFLARGDSEKALRQAILAHENFSKLEDRIEEENALQLREKIQKSMKTPIPTTDSFGLLEVMGKIARLLKSFGNTEEMLEHILDEALNFVGAERGIIFLKREETGDYYPTVQRNIDKTTMMELNYSNSIIQTTVAQRDMVFSYDARNDERFRNFQSINALNILSLCCSPMIVENEVIGVIYVDTRRQLNLFSDRDRAFLNQFADLAAAFIIKSNFFQEQQKELHSLKETVSGEFTFDNIIIGRSEVMQSIFSKLHTICKHENPVLLIGENGTGKSLIARTIHLNSTRKNQQFMLIKCPALSDSLLETELFGYTKGTFPNLYYDRPGAFEQAHGGTIFLDEIADIRKDLQAKLLYVMETGAIRKAGVDTPIPIDVRIIASSSKNLEREVAYGNFRQELFYMLNLFTIPIPPLRERVEDIPLLATEFMQKFREKYKKNIEGFSQDAIDCLTHYLWPGNIRELEQAIQYAVLFCRIKIIRRKDLPANLQAVKRSPKEKANLADVDLRTLKEVESEHIRGILRYTHGKKVETCNILNISRPTLDRKLKIYGIKTNAS